MENPPLTRDSKLALVTTTALIEELLSRFDTAIFAGIRDEGKKVSASGSTFELKLYRGDGHKALGLLSRLNYHINMNYDKHCVPSEDV